MTDLDKLEELAKAATPGEWFWTAGLEKGEASLDVAGSTQFVLSATGMHSEGFLSVDEADAEFIAAANPSAVLALIADHRAVLARIAKAEALADAAIAEHSGRPDTTHYESCWKYHAGCFATALKATLTEGENE